MLRRWWTDKYRLPWTPNNIEDFTVLDLLTEFYEDLFEKDKNALYDASRGEDGEIMFESTGDPLIDKWEQELAMGLEPDLTEGMSDEDRATDEKQQSIVGKAKRQFQELGQIDDSYRTNMLSPLDLLGKGK